MKKRFLSAALALAMVLTMLPAMALPVFAADATDSMPESGKTTVQYLTKQDDSKLDSNKQGVGPGWVWQYKDADGKTHWTCDKTGSIGGIVSGTNASGTWYDTSITTPGAVGGYINANGTLKTSSFTLVGNLSITAAPLVDNSVGGTLNVNLFGNNLTMGGATVLNRYNSLTITDTYYTRVDKNTRGSVNGIARDVSSYDTTADRTAKSNSGFTLNVTGATVTDGISLKGRGNRVTLTGAAVTGDITLDGTTAQTTNGKTTNSWPGQTLTISSQAAQPTYGMPVLRPTVTGNITVTGNGSNVSLTDVSGITATKVYSTGGSVKVDGVANISSIMEVGVGPDNAKNSAPAAVTINDGYVAILNRTDYPGDQSGMTSNSTTAGKVDINKDAIVGKLWSFNGTVGIHSANVGKVTLEQGTLTIDGSGAKVGLNAGDGGINLPIAGKTTFNFRGTGHVIGNISAPTATGLTLALNTDWPTGRTNTFGTVNLGAYAGGGIKGGIFATRADSEAGAKWFSGLQFMRKTADGKYAYYGPKELGDAIADAGAAAATTGVDAATGAVTETDLLLSVMGSDPERYVGFYNSTIDAQAGPNKAIALLAYGDTTNIYLPDKINGTPVTAWTNVKEAKTYNINEQQALMSSVPTGTIKLVLQSTGAAISKLSNAEAAGSNPNVTVTMNGNTITLSGAVGQKDYEDIEIKFTTDLIDSDGNPVFFIVPVAYDTNAKTAVFGSLGVDKPEGVTINNTSIVVGNNTYTLNVSGLAKPAPSLMVADMPGSAVTGGKKIVPTINVSMTPAAKEDLIGYISGTNAEFDWTHSPAMRQAVNSAMATITNDKTLENWVTTVQRAAWNIKHQGGSPTATDLSSTGFNTVVLVPYLAMTVTQYNANGTMTANLVPSYRVEVRNTNTSHAYYGIFANRQNGTEDGNYIIQAGRPLPQAINNLTGSTAGDVGVTIKFNNLPTGFDNAYMHQDATYVYPTTTGTYTLTHAGKTGLGTIVLNSTPHTVEMTRLEDAIDQNGQKVGAGGAIAYYDSLQAAVDDTLPQLMTHLDTVTVKSSYTGSGAISVSGEARAFDIVTEGNTTITSNASGDVVKVSGTGHNYTVQLLKNNVTTASIVVNNANNGTAAIITNNANAKPGETVTVRVTPNAGFSGNITAKTNTGAAVNVTNNGDNTFTFKVPEGATRVEVTPVFMTGSQLPFTDVAASSNYYTAVKYCYDHNLIMGTTATSFAPNSTITRAQIVTILWRQAGAKTQVPQGMYKDMPGNSDYYNAIIWASNNGIATGYEDGKFYPDRPINRQELATFLYRYQVNYLKRAASGSVTSLNGYTDGYQTGTWATNAMRWAVGNGIVTGTGNRLTPTSAAPRYQAAIAMYQYCGGVLGIV